MRNEASPLTLPPFTLWRGSRQLFKDFALRLAPGEITVIVGASGIGKSTLIDALAEASARRNHGHAPAVSLMPQHPQLAPWLSVKENMMLNSQLSGVWPAHPEHRFLELCRALKVVELESRFPAELSGGQYQRICLGQALWLPTPLVLLDEPFSELDPTLRRDLRCWLRMQLKAASSAAVISSHNYDDAVAIGDRILILHDNPVKVHREIQLSASDPRARSEALESLLQWDCTQTLQSFENAA